MQQSGAYLLLRILRWLGVDRCAFSIVRYLMNERVVGQAFVVPRSRLSFVLVYDADRFWTHTGGMVRSNIHRRGIFLNEQHKRTKYLRSSQSLPHRRAKNCPIDAPLLQHRRARNFIIGELKSAPYTFLHLFYKPFLRNMMNVSRFFRDTSYYLELQEKLSAL